MSKTGALYQKKMRLPVFLTSILLCVDARIGDNWGTNIHWTSGQSGEPEMLAQAFKVARMDLNWQAVESVCGQYDFSAYDTLVQQLTSVGVKPYLILDYWNTCYGTPCINTTCFEGYGNFAKATAAHFAGYNIIYESVNEPNGMGRENDTDITGMAEYAGRAFSSAGAFFIGPATAGIDFNYLNKTFNDGILNYYSAVSVHPYRAGPPESAIDDYTNLRTMMEQNIPPGKQNMEIIGGEWGYTSADPPCTYGNRVDKVTQAKYVARMWLSNAISGVFLSIDYDWKNDSLNLTDCESNFGSVYANYTGNVSTPFVPKPAYIAALTLQNTVGNAEVITGRIPMVTSQPSTSANDIFIIGFGGIPSKKKSDQCGNTPTTDCGFPGITPEQCTQAGCCFNNQTPGPWCYEYPSLPAYTGFALWTNATMCPSSPPTQRSDCGFNGITLQQCTDRQCCWDDNPGNGPQCYSGDPINSSNPLTVSFSVFPDDSNFCYSSIGLLGDNQGQICASNGMITVTNVTDAPLYLV